MTRWDRHVYRWAHAIAVCCRVSHWGRNPPIKPKWQLPENPAFAPPLHIGPHKKHFLPLWSPLVGTKWSAVNAIGTFVRSAAAQQYCPRFIHTLKKAIRFDHRWVRYLILFLPVLLVVRSYQERAPTHTATLLVVHYDSLKIWLWDSTTWAYVAQGTAKWIVLENPLRVSLLFCKYNFQGNIPFWASWQHSILTTYSPIRTLDYSKT